MRVGGFVGIGIGAAGLVMGSVAGALAIAKENEMVRECGPASDNDVIYCKSQAGIDAGNSARLRANVGTIGFGIAAAGAIAGTVLLVLDKRKGQAPKEPSEPNVVAARLGVGTSGIGISIEGVW